MARWMVAAMVGLILVGNGLAQDGTTRYGTLDFNDQGVLSFKGREIHPKIEHAYLGETYRMGATDVVLVTKEGGSGCPVVYFLVSVTKEGATSTPYVGTCQQAKSIERHGDTIIFTMQGFQGPFEPEEKRQKAFHETHVFVFKDGKVTDNGKPLQ
jgi:hypothetical protein